MTVALLPPPHLSLGVTAVEQRPPRAAEVAEEDDAGRRVSWVLGEFGLVHVRRGTGHPPPVVVQGREAGERAYAAVGDLQVDPADQWWQPEADSAFHRLDHVA
ncbi:hypothetical protein [Streptomyces sp. L2]|uniref:hypothetical protein n=1 Tax=Streptomyces sp. L2 TaxID=2162665 RepID=UPI001F508551|nr:hypothetical protein [Streptomyces sp. L2]